MSRTTGFVVGGLVVALLIGGILSSFAASDPDGLESAVIATQCEGAADSDACLSEAAGDPVYNAAPLADYRLTPLSGVLGVLACFAIGGGLVLLLKRTSGAAPGGTRPEPRTRQRVE